MSNVNGKNTGLYQSLKLALAPHNFREEEIDLIYTCFVHCYAGAKYLPGQRLINLVHKLTTYLIRETKGT